MSEEKTKCAHSKYKANVKVTMAQVPQLDVNTLVALITMKCVTCGKDFVWKGRQGFSSADPLVSPDMFTLRAPLLPPPDEEIEEIVLPSKLEKSIEKMKKQEAKVKKTVH
jgi:hypothetical protein